MSSGDYTIIRDILKRSDGALRYAVPESVEKKDGQDEDYKSSSNEDQEKDGFFLRVFRRQRPVMPRLY